MKYKVGDKVRIVDKRTGLMDPNGLMDYWLGKTMTIDAIWDGFYLMQEDDCEWYWCDDMIAGKAKEEKHSSEYYLFRFPEN